MSEDWHTHNKLCRHAKGNIEDYIREAIKKGLDTIGISDHFPYEFYRNFERIPYQEYSMTLGEINDYISTVEKLREEYKGKITVRIAFEIDYILNQVDILNSKLKEIQHKLDYILGSLHVLYSDRGPWCFDDSRFLKEFDRYESIDNIYLEYYDLHLKMIKDENFNYDIVSHLDLPKKFGKIPRNKENIQNKVWQVLESIKKRNLVVEINTGGFRKEIGQQYPSMEIIEKMYELDIPILLGSDAHKPIEVGYRFDTIKEELKEIGYSQLAHFEKRKRSFIDIN
jgi:histidinol-phosphatase (PHP family)